jgi:hypothetical protein
MTIEQLIADNTTALQALTAAVADLMQHLGGAAETPAPVGEKPALAPKPAPAPIEEPTPAPEPVAEKPAKAPKGDPVTYDDVKASTLALHKAAGRDAVVAILTTYGCDNATKLDKKQWSAYVADCKKAMP